MLTQCGHSFFCVQNTKKYCEVIFGDGIIYITSTTKGSDRMYNKDGYISSLDIARMLNKQHKVILRTIRNYLYCDSIFSEWYYESEYTDNRGRKQLNVMMNQNAVVLIMLSINGDNINKIKYDLINSLNINKIPELTTDNNVIQQSKSVYLSNRTVKIGISKNIDTRFKTIENVSGMNIVRHKVFGPTQKSREIEIISHDMFDSRRLNGEFFDIPFDLAVSKVSDIYDMVTAA